MNANAARRYVYPISTDCGRDGEHVKIGIIFFERVYVRAALHKQNAFCLDFPFRIISASPERSLNAMYLLCSSSRGIVVSIKICI